jgi:microcystin-dependent protein
MSDYFLGEIRMFGGNFAIKNWATCDGQLMSIAQNTALFSLLGTTYGGNGIQTFALPDLRGRLPLHQGQGPSLTNRTLGESGGVEQVTVTLNSMPMHSHSLFATLDNATLSNVAGNVLTGKPTVTGAFFYTVPGAAPTTSVQLAPTAIGFAGGSQPHTNLMPALCLTFIIALQGLFPSRN